MSVDAVIQVLVNADRRQREQTERIMAEKMYEK
jgi:hypothetical protein